MRILTEGEGLDKKRIRDGDGYTETDEIIQKQNRDGYVKTRRKTFGFGFLLTVCFILILFCLLLTYCLYFSLNI